MNENSLFLYEVNYMLVGSKLMPVLLKLKCSNKSRFVDPDVKI